MTQATAAAVQLTPFDVIRAAVAVTTVRGYYQPQTRPQEEAIPTAMDVRALLYGHEPTERGDRTRFARAMAETAHLPAAILQWATGADREGNGYRATLARTAAARQTSDRDIPLLSSAVSAWRKDQERTGRAAQADTDRAKSRHQGEEGDRLKIRATVASKVRLPDDHYGYRVQSRHILKLRDAAGSIYVWFASTRNLPDEDDQIQLTGTVSKHDTYRDTAQTCLTRCRWSAAEDQPQA